MITLAKLKERLSYNPLNGEFRYLVNVAQMKAGQLAGRPNTNGHIQISIDYIRYMAHNLAWFYMTGEYPTFIVDHKDKNYANNTWSNLRKCNNSENAGNSKIYTNNSSGFKGVC